MAVLGRGVDGRLTPKIVSQIDTFGMDRRPQAGSGTAKRIVRKREF